jgi:hypothetical protein
LLDAMAMTSRTTALTLLVLATLAGRATAQDAFAPERLARTRAMFEANAANQGEGHMDCITTLNAGMRVLFDDPLLQLGSQIDHTFRALQGMGLAGQARVIEFNDERGKLTYGVTAPATLRESVWDTIRGLVGTSRGWNVFGLSLMDGYHSVTINVDTSDPSRPRMYWSDQWSSNGGFREHTRESLDAEVQRLTTSWWSSEKKFRTRATLWRCTPSSASRVATVLTGTLNVRAQPSTSAPIVERVRRLDRLRVVGKRGMWLEVERRDGSRGWVHEAYVRTNRGVLPTGTVTASTAPTTGLIGSVPQ